MKNTHFEPRYILALPLTSQVSVHTCIYYILFDCSGVYNDHGVYLSDT